MTTPPHPDEPRRDAGAWHPHPDRPPWPAADPTRTGPPPESAPGWGTRPDAPPPGGDPWGPPQQGQPWGSPGGPQWAPPQQPAWGQQQPQGQQPAWGQQQPWGQHPAWGQQPGWGGYPPPPRRGRGTVIALVLVGVLVLAGLGVGAFLLVRSTGGPGPSPEPAAALRDVTAAGLTYGVPIDWTADPTPNPTIAGLPAEGVYNGAPYRCNGNNYLRGFTAAANVGLDLPADVAAEQVAQLAGTTFYQPAVGGPAEVRVSGARPVDVGGVQAQLAEATITAVDDGCLATGGTILVLAVPVTPPGGTPGLAVLLVNGDTVGGPADAPPVPDRALLDAMIASARPAGI